MTDTLLHCSLVTPLLVSFQMRHCEKESKLSVTQNLTREHNERHTRYDMSFVFDHYLPVLSLPVFLL